MLLLFVKLMLETFNVKISQKLLEICQVLLQWQPSSQGLIDVGKSPKERFMCFWFTAALTRQSKRKFLTYLFFWHFFMYVCSSAKSTACPMP